VSCRKLVVARASRSRVFAAFERNKLKVGLPNFSECLPQDLNQAVEVNNHAITFNCLILGFLYFWLGVIPKSALADTKPIGQKTDNSAVSHRQTSIALQDASDSPLNWGTSSDLLAPQEPFGFDNNFRLNNNIAPPEPNIPLNQPGNNITPSVQNPSLNQPDTNSTPPQAYPQLNQPDTNNPYLQQNPSLTQPDTNNTSPQQFPQLNQPDINRNNPEETSRTQGLRGNSLESSHPSLNTAHQLFQGEILTRLRYRQSFPPKEVLGNLTGQPTLGFSWGITDNLEITLDAQTVDNAGPARQGPFLAQRTTSPILSPETGSGNFFQELTLQGKHRIWQNSTGTQALSGVFAISRGRRSYRFTDLNGNNLPGGGNKDELVTSLELPFTVTTGDRWQFTLSPKAAFLPEDNALYFRRPPLADPGSFGTTFGLAGGAIYRANSRLLLWGDAFVPFTGNNTIDRDTGLPDRVVAVNAGLRYLVNPRLATDLFFSNTLGNTGALSVIADKEFPYLGLGVTFIPGVTTATRRYPTSFGGNQQPSPATPAGFAFLDGGTIRSGQLLTTLQGGGQGFLAAIQYGVLDDFEIGVFLDSIPGTIDESELGFSGKIRFLNQADGAPFTLSGVVTLARSNNVMINLINDNPNEFTQRGFKKRGFHFANEGLGELFIITLSAPINYQLKNGSAVWVTPTVGFVQDNGLQIAGVNVGGSLPLRRNLSAIAEAGLEFGGKGNAFIGNNRETEIPWNLGLRWNPNLRGAISGLEVEAYLTNRVGSSPFHSLRVQADNPTTVGVGVRLPIQF